MPGPPARTRATRLPRPRNDEGKRTMKAFVLAVVAAVVIAIGWAGFLDRIQEPASQAYSTQGVRL